MNKNSLQKYLPNAKAAANTFNAVVAGVMMSSVFAFADVNSAINSVFNVGNSVAGAISSGLASIVVPIGIAVAIYFLVRMLLAGDPKDVTMYRKRLITTVIIVIVAAAVPGLMAVANNLGTQVNSQLK